MDTDCTNKELCRQAESKNNDFIDPLVERICATYADTKGINHNEGHNLPRESEILAVLNELLEVIFPGFAEREAHSVETLRYAVGEIISRTHIDLKDIIYRSYKYHCAVFSGEDCTCNCPSASESATRFLLESLPEIRETMKLDIQAAFDGDPAAKSLDEVVLSYPGIKAITIQRLAHNLYIKKVPLIPRMMSEYAHRVTGIDIHPGAKLGKGIFIDHGTGVVIGETAEIGSGSKIYQGVTLGALSFPKDSCGMIIKGAKRHPTIGDNVTIYAGATILGPIIVGNDSIIGGNVWLTESVEPGSKIIIAPPELNIFKRKSK